MLYYFDVVLGPTRVADPEGTVCDTLSAAITEAEAIARNIAAETLSNNGAVAPDWRVEIFDVGRGLTGSVFFYDVIFEPLANVRIASLLRRHVLGLENTSPVTAFKRAQSLIDETRAVTANVRATFSEIRKQLDQLA